MQNKVYRTATDVPQVLKKTLDKETFEKARVYGKDKNVFSTFSDFYSTVVLSVSVILCTLNGVVEIALEKTVFLEQLVDIAVEWRIVRWMETDTTDAGICAIYLAERLG